jgi:hypothetical protein
VPCEVRPLRAGPALVLLGWACGASADGNPSYRGGCRVDVQLGPIGWMVSVVPGGLEELAVFIRRKNAIDAEIAAIVGRPAQMGHVGEYIAAQVFDILLEHSASTRSIDGYFATAPLAGRSVNIKWYGKQEGSWILRATTRQITTWC